MNRNARMAAIQAESESRFSNYTGQPTASELVGIQDRMSNMGGGGAPSPMIDFQAMTRDLKFTVTNTDEKNALAVPLFSASERIALPFNGVKDEITGNIAQTGKGIMTKIQGLSDNEVLDMIRNEPFVIAGLRYEFGDRQQLKQDWLIRYKQDRSVTTTPYTPHQDYKNSIDGGLEDPSFVLKVDRGTTLYIVIAAAHDEGQPREVQILFKIGSSTNVSNVLEGKSAIIKHGQQFAQHQNVKVF